VARGSYGTEPPRDARGLRYADDELQESSPLSVTSLAQTLRLRLASELEAFRALLSQVFDDVQAVDARPADAPPSDGDFEVGFVVGGAVAADVFRLPEQGARELVLAWDASPLGDVVADAVVCLALHSEAWGPARLSDERRVATRTARRASRGDLQLSPRPTLSEARYLGRGAGRVEPAPRRAPRPS